LLNGNEKKYLQQCIDTGWISSEGPFVKEFEENFASRVGRKYGIAVANGLFDLNLLRLFGRNFITLHFISFKNKVFKNKPTGKIWEI
jgi:hypothetical protein